MRRSDENKKGVKWGIRINEDEVIKETLRYAEGPFLPQSFLGKLLTMIYESYS